MMVKLLNVILKGVSWQVEVGINRHTILNSYLNLTYSKILLIPIGISTIFEYWSIERSYETASVLLKNANKAVRKKNRRNPF